MEERDQGDTSCVYDSAWTRSKRTFNAIACQSNISSTFPRKQECVSRELDLDYILETTRYPHQTTVYVYLTLEDIHQFFLEPEEHELDLPTARLQ
jgi:hypothetical protein